MGSWSGGNERSEVGGGGEDLFQARRGCNSALPVLRSGEGTALHSTLGLDYKINNL